MTNRDKILVKCSFCGKEFGKYSHHYKENLRLGCNFYCSRKCLNKNRKTGKFLVCDNPKCSNRFYRCKAALSENNYCSRSCAVSVNNRKHPKREKGFNYVNNSRGERIKIKTKHGTWTECSYKKCNNRLNEGYKFCSIKCYRFARLNYSKEEVIEEILNYFKKYNRVPPKRSLIKVASSATRVFGSWNNAVSEAGLEPNRSYDHRMYKREMVKALDGHFCDSISEAIIDDWFTENDIEHKLDVDYPNTHHKADWAVDNGKVFVEYFGLANDSKRYDRCVRKKKKICKEEGIDLIEIYPKDIYTKDRDEILKVKLGKFGVFS